MLLPPGLLICCCFVTCWLQYCSHALLKYCRDIQNFAEVRIHTQCSQCNCFEACFSCMLYFFRPAKQYVIVSLLMFTYYYTSCDITLRGIFNFLWHRHQTKWQMAYSLSSVTQMHCVVNECTTASKQQIQRKPRPCQWKILCCNRRYTTAVQIYCHANGYMVLGLDFLATLRHTQNHAAVI